MNSQPNNFTASDIVAIIRAGGESNVEQISIVDLHIKFKSKESLVTQLKEFPKSDPEDTPEIDQAPSYDDGSLMITDPMKYEEQAMEG